MTTRPSKKARIISGPPRLFGKTPSRETVDSLSEKLTSIQADVAQIKEELRGLQERVDSLSED
jgi:hypothetical protein